MKKMANVAEHHVIDAKKFVFSMGRRTMSTVSTSSSSSKEHESTKTKTEVTRSKTDVVTHHRNDSSLLANTLLWAHLIPPMPVIASAMYRHYAKGNVTRDLPFS